MSEMVQPQRNHAKYTWSTGLAILTSLPILIWLDSVGNPTIYFEYETPPGQLYYVFSKLAGLYAIILIWMQALLALLNRTPLGEHISFWSPSFHRTLGLSAMACLLLHALLFMVAVSLRKDTFAYTILLPQLGQGFYPFAVTLGVFGLYGLLITSLFGFLRTLGLKAATWLHRIALPAFVLVFIHGLLIGTETRHLAISLIYVVMGGSFTAALIYRLSVQAMDADHKGKSIELYTPAE